MKRFFAVLTLCVLSRFSFAATLPVDASFDGKTLDAKVGDVVEIKLDGNPTTGYSWSTTKLQGDSVKQNGDPAYAQKNNDGRVGGGGTFTFKFTVEKVGQSTLNLGYARPWEKVDPIQKFTLVVKVEGKAPATQPATQPATRPILNLGDLFPDRTLQAQIVKAKTEIKNIETALDAFEIDTGNYPTQNEGLEILFNNTSNIKEWHGPYINKNRLDPWGNDYKYNHPGKHNPQGHDVISAGPDGKFDTADDIFNK
jgi:general secretion pathway protein G